jgi:hypothetical protein
MPSVLGIGVPTDELKIKKRKQMHHVVEIIKTYSLPGETPAQTLVRLYEADPQILKEIARARGLGHKGMMLLCELFGFPYSDAIFQKRPH